MVDLTVREASTMLEPPITEKQLRTIITALHWQPAGVRVTGRGGRPAPVYPWSEILKLHMALTPWLETREGCEV